MYKELKILLTLFIIGQFTGIGFAQGAEAITIGTVYTYRIVESEWDYVAGSAGSMGWGFKFQDQLFSCNKSLTATVEEVDYLYVNFTVTVDSQSASYAFNQMDVLGFMSLQAYPFLFVIGIVNFVETEADYGLSLRHMYYLPPSVVNSHFTQLTDESYINEYYSDDEHYTYNDVGGSFDTGSTINSFTWVMDAQYVDESAGTDYGGTYSYSIKYHETTGLLYEYRIDFAYAGTYEHTTVDLESHQEMKLQDTPTTTNNSRLSTIVSVLSLSVMATIALICKRRKKERSVV
jgi:hypothetical protein